MVQYGTVLSLERVLLHNVDYTSITSTLELL